MNRLYHVKNVMLRYKRLANLLFSLLSPLLPLLSLYPARWWYATLILFIAVEVNRIVVILKCNPAPLPSFLYSLFAEFMALCDIVCNLDQRSASKCDDDTVPNRNIHQPYIILYRHWWWCWCCRIPWSDIRLLTNPVSVLKQLLQSYKYMTSKHATVSKSSHTHSLFHDK